MLSDLIKPRVCELGKIKIGGLGEERAKSSGSGTYRMPEKHDCFTVTTLHRDAKGDLIPDAELMASLKDMADPDGKLRQLPISLLSNDLEDVMQAAYVWYQGKRLAGRGDGKTLTKFFDLGRQQWLPTPDVRPWKPEYADLTGPDGKKLFKLHVTLNCVIAAPSARWGGVYKFRSTSQITAEGLYGSFTQLRLLTGGQLRGLPLRLVVRPIQVSPEGKPITVYVVHAELRGPDLQAIQTLALERAKHEIDNAKQLGELQQQYRALLAAPGDRESEEEQAEVAAEFHPDQPVADAAATPAGASPATPTGGQHTSPPTSPASFDDRVDAASDEPTLDAIVADMRAAFDAKKLDHVGRVRLAAKVKARREAVKAAATAAEMTADRAAATEPATTNPKS